MEQPSLRVEPSHPRSRMDTLTSAPISTSRSSGRSVAPIYVVVITRSCAPRRMRTSSCSSRNAEAVPLHERAQQIHPIGRHQLPLHPPIHGWSRPLTSNALEERGTSGRGVGSGRPGSAERSSISRSRLARLVDEFIGRVGRGRHRKDGCRDLVCNRDLLRDRVCVIARNRSEGAACEACQVRSEHLVRVCRIEGSPINQLRIERTEPCAESRCDQLLVQSARKPVHAKNLRSRMARLPDHPRPALPDGANWSRQRHVHCGRPGLETAMTEDAAP